MSHGEPIEWIACKDRFPEVEGTYWVIWIAGLDGMNIIKMNWHPNFCWHSFEFEVKYWRGISHWVPFNEINIPKRDI